MGPLRAAEAIGTYVLLTLIFLMTSALESAATPSDTSEANSSSKTAHSIAIDRPVQGGVMRKEPGSESWYFVKALSEAEVAQRIEDYRHQLVRERGDSSHEVVIAVRSEADVQQLLSFGISSPSAPPCTLTTILKYRDVSSLHDAGIVMWGAADKRHATQSSDNIRPQPASSKYDGGPLQDFFRPAPEHPPSTQAVTLYTEGFESGTLAGWISQDTNSASDYDYWGSLFSNCTYVHSGSRAADCAAFSDRPCFQYDNDMTAYLYHQTSVVANTSTYSSFHMSFWVRYATQYPTDYLEWYYDFGQGFIPVQKFAGNSVNGQGQPDYIYLEQFLDNGSGIVTAIRLQFLFVSNAIDVNQGAQVDDILIRGEPFLPNLTWATPSGWSGPIVPSSVTGTNTVGALYAAPEPTYIDGAVVNNGDAGTGASFFVDFYLDGITYLARVSSNALGVSQWTYFQDIFNNASIAAGSHFIQMRLDATNAIAEKFEGDNTYNSQSFVWNPARKDIVVDQVTVTPANPLVGQQVDIQVTIRNAGPGDITTNFLLDYYRNRASAPPLGTPGDQSQTITQPFYAGTSRTLHFYEVSNSPATWSSYVFADRNGQVVESSESNNIVNRTIIWASGNVIVSGQFVYDDSLSLPGSPNRPLQCVKVTIYDQDPATGDPDPDDDPLAVTYTTASGSYGPITLSNRDSDQADLGLLDLYVVAEFSTSTGCRPTQAVVVRDADNDPWILQSIVITNAANGTLNFGTLEPGDSPRKRALHIYHVVLRGYDWVRARGSTPGSVNAVWYPEKPEKTRYDPGLVAIEINSKIGNATNGEPCGPDEYDDYPILHEYGHHIAQVFGAAPLADGCPGIDFSNASCAMSEGWADWFASQMVQASPTPVLRNWARKTAVPADTTVLLRNLETGLITWRVPSNPPTWMANQTGEDYAPGVFSTLWDVSDTPSDNQPGVPGQPGIPECWDEMADPVSRTWQVATVHPGIVMNRFCNFANHYYQTYLQGDPEGKLRLKHTLCEHLVNCQGVLDVPREVAKDFWVGGAWPNPSKSESRVRFRLPSDRGNVPVLVEVYDLAGARMRTLFTGVPSSPELEVAWDGLNGTGKLCHSGVYFVRLKADGRQLTTSLVRLH